MDFVVSADWEPARKNAWPTPGCNYLEALGQSDGFLDHPGVSAAASASGSGEEG